MKLHMRTFQRLVAAMLMSSSPLFAKSLPPAVETFVQKHCISCHDAATTSRVDFEAAAFDLSTKKQRRFWSSVHDQIAAGKMPPKAETRPARSTVARVTQILTNELRSATLQAHQSIGRVPARRLTRTEYEYSVRDILSIDGDFAAGLPLESSDGNFDTVAATQHFSAMHVEGYLATTDKAINTALRLHKSPFRQYEFDLLNNKHLNSFHERDLQIGGNISRRMVDGVAIFRDVDYLLRSDLHGFRIRSTGSGYYQIRISAEAFQSSSPMAMKVVVKDISGATKLVGACDLLPGETKLLEVKAWLTRTKVFYVSFMEDRPAAQILADIYDDGGGSKYTGPGIKINSIKVEGPQTGGWPPVSTRQLLTDVDFKVSENGDYETDPKNAPVKHVAAMVERLAMHAFRRPLTPDERNAYVAIAKPKIDENLPLEQVVRLPIRAILSAPQFVTLAGKAGALDDHSLASRLSYFLWKTVPDQQLADIALEGRLSSSDVLNQQVERMLDDKRSNRFVDDFLGQWLRLKEINATTPDEKLYPEYDELLHWSIPQETVAVFNELIAKDLSIANLIDSDFTFLNRRLANHYGISDVNGQQFRRVELPEESVRGGILTQAAILKVTANGLTTSPVKRGNFVLTDLLGTPPPPPPDDVGSIEPDVRKATTIRDLLAIHRNSDACWKCHQQIDPPGFAMECFDPIGAFRTHYRINGDDFLTFVAHKDGAEVDASGTTEDGNKFQGISEFRQQLMAKREQLARHFISQLIVYSTGGEIEFSDRMVVEAIVNRTRERNFPVRTIIHEVIQSRLFKER